jgi:hypothetical protein
MYGNHGDELTYRSQLLVSQEVMCVLRCRRQNTVRVDPSSLSLAFLTSTQMEGKV